MSLSKHFDRERKNFRRQTSIVDILLANDYNIVMEKQKIVAKYSVRSMRRQAYIMWIIAAVVIAVAIPVYFWRKLMTYPLILGAIALVLLVLGIIYFLSGGKEIFSIEGLTLCVKDRKYDMKGVIFNASVVFGRENPSDSTLDQISVSAPIYGLSGNITIQAGNMLFKFTNVEDVLGVMEKVKDVTQEFLITLWHAGSHRRYQTFGGNPVYYKNEVNYELEEKKNTQSENPTEQPTEDHQDSQE